MTRLRALVLEDEWLARNYLVQLIEATQLAEVVGAVATIGEARDVLAALPVDVVFVDVQLSGDENGLELVQSMASSDRGRQHERWPRAVRGCHRLHELETILVPGKLHVDEHHVHRQRREHVARLAAGGDRAHHFGELRRLDQLHQVVARQPFVFEHERAQACHDRASSSGISTIDRVPVSEDSSRKLARSAYCKASRLCTECSPNAPGRFLPSGIPRPLSSTVQTSFFASTTSARTSMRPPSSRASAPWFTAFSTSGWSRSRGRSAVRVPAPRFQWNARRPACRSSRMCA